MKVGLQLYTAIQATSLHISCVRGGGGVHRSQHQEGENEKLGQTNVAGAPGEREHGDRTYISIVQTAELQPRQHLHTQQYISIEQRQRISYMYTFFFYLGAL
jgi:hypothetical protein